MDLSILIPARNEMFLVNTVRDILRNRRADTEVIVICDGSWPNPELPKCQRVKAIYHEQSIGQRAAVNEAARQSRAKFVMKADAHCAFARGFDATLVKDCERDWTVVPRLYNLHCFDWQCIECGRRTYQGPCPKRCKRCRRRTEHRMVLVWKPRWHRRTDYSYFDTSLHFQYWPEYEKRSDVKSRKIDDVLGQLGACWMMQRERYWELGGLDEGHGSWGQMGTEISCKSWLSGGRQVVNKSTWYSHMFRTQDGWQFPYKITDQEIMQARQYSWDLWLEDKWPMAVHPLSWLIEKFAPVPDWEHACVVS